ncbi:MAG: hypothetical protein GY786_24925, partial [Proteobacteria bacterium]|nr:hypothetical protein [Pseudomonadota bacterium]
FAVYRNQLVEVNKRKGETLSINWPLWKEGGMEVDRSVEAAMEQASGVVSMLTKTGIHAFYQILSAHHPQTVVMEGLVSKMRRDFFSQRVQPELQERQEEDQVLQAASVRVIDKESLLTKIQGMLIKEVSKAIKLNPQQIQLDVEFDRYGFDSILLMNFVNQLNQKYELELMPTIFFEYSTIGA